MKTDRNLLKVLKEEEYVGAYKDAFKSAEHHKKTAEIVADNDHYGIPVSHLILSTEQLVSGLLIYFQSKGVDIKNVPRVYLFFTDHIVKHKLATLISVAYPIMRFQVNQIQKYLADKQNGVKIPNSTEKISLTMKKELLTEFRNLPDLLDWWDNANTQKNRGFYVDYSNGFITPMQVSKDEYQSAFRIVEEFHFQVSEVIRAFEQMAEQGSEKDMDRLKSRLKDALERVISSRRKKNETSSEEEC